ncbi:UNVERIFIED_CONTAM: hypothetical protein GTU68_056975 [Idotea baltica]|nr:hypothetical protein [Idotea baltica]
MKVLVCEDDKKLRLGLVEILESEGYETVEAEDGEQSLSLFTSERPSFVLLDIMMSGMSGYDVCRMIREKDREVPIMFISAKSEEIDRVLGLELGADDYIVKPFGVNEVISRIRAITRRCYRQIEATEKPAEESFDMAGIIIKPRELRAIRDGEVLELSLRDIKMLQLFFREAGNVVTRNEIFNQCWGTNYLPNSRTLDQHISKLRKKIGDDPKNASIIETVHGVGYRYQT